MGSKLACPTIYRRSISAVRLGNILFEYSFDNNGLCVWGGVGGGGGGGGCLGDQPLGPLYEINLECLCAATGVG